MASEFRYRKPILDARTLVVALSQSGETADTLAAIREAKEKGALTIGIVNVVGSSIARETDAGVYCHAGPEVSVASTKAFTSQLAILSLLTMFLGRQRNLSLTMGKRIAKELNGLPKKIEEILSQVKGIEKIAKKIRETGTLSLSRSEVQLSECPRGCAQNKRNRLCAGAGVSDRGDEAWTDRALVTPVSSICYHDKKSTVR
jgi:glucosamine 6-phosphate synthetase-like amidotransferase/phosphosugar isomerase protein